MLAFVDAVQKFISDPFHALLISTLCVLPGLVEAEPTAPEGWIDVTDHGAVPDDDQPDANGIQQAINRAEELDGGTVHLPRGTYRIDRSVEIHDHGVVLKGDGYGTVLRNAGAEEAVIQSLSRDRDPHTSLHNVIIEKLRIDGVDRSVTGVMASGLTRGSVIRDLYIARCRDGIDLSGCWSLSLERNNIDHCARAGILLGEGGMRSESLIERKAHVHHYTGEKSTPVVNAIVLIGNHTSHSEYGLRYGHGSGWTMAGNTFENNQRNVFLRSPNAGAVIGNYFEGSNSEAPLVEVGTDDGNGILTNTIIGGNRFYDQDVPGLGLRGMINSQVLANEFDESEGIEEPTGFHRGKNVRSRIYGNQYFRGEVPDSPDAPGVNGQIAWDEDFLYICVAPNKWKRVKLSSEW